jgi:small subunit ribosomal protein S17
MPDQTSTQPAAAAVVAAGPRERGVRKEFVGTVTSNKMDKTVVVRVDRRVPHPKYGKIITKSSKFYAHNDENKAKLGDCVRIVETRPLSKLKRWRVVEVLPMSHKARAHVTQEEV